jgi:AcrR family transcriptional regulator
MIPGMKTPLRLIRETASHIPGLRPTLSPQEEARKRLILDGATTLFARHGRHAMTMAEFAECIWMSPRTIKRHFIDLDVLLHTILAEHLETLAAAIPPTLRDPTARLTAYFAATRHEDAPTDAQILLIRDLETLPEDLRASLEQRHAEIAAPDNPKIAAGLLSRNLLHTVETSILLKVLLPASAPQKPAQATQTAAQTRHKPAEAQMAPAHASQGHAQTQSRQGEGLCPSTPSKAEPLKSLLKEGVYGLPLAYPSNPATAPLRHVANVPDTTDRIPKPTISPRLSGTIDPIPPTNIPRLPKFANPHKQNVTISLERALNALAGNAANPR